MQMEMEIGGSKLYGRTTICDENKLIIWFRFFDLFVAMCNHVDDIVDMYVISSRTFYSSQSNTYLAPTTDLPKPSKCGYFSISTFQIPEIHRKYKLIKTEKRTLPSKGITTPLNQNAALSERISPFSEAGELVPNNQKRKEKKKKNLHFCQIILEVRPILCESNGIQTSLNLTHDGFFSPISIGASSLPLWPFTLKSTLFGMPLVGGIIKRVDQKSEQEKPNA